MSRCLSSKVDFNTSTLEKIIFEPNIILENERNFWENERAQKLTTTWAHIINHQIDLKKWREELKEWSSLPLSTREGHIFYKNAKKILNRKEMIIEKSLNHICKFLPHDANLDVKILFTAFIPSRCFANEDIVFNVNAEYWNNNIDNMINSIVHELFHIGYGYCRDFHRDPSKDKNYEILDQIVNEGVSTYVAYKALEIFPAPDEKDFQLLEDKLEVKRLINEVNEVLDKSTEVSKDELNKLIMEKCIKGRAYYISGAYACQIVDEKLGRKKLIELLMAGPVHLIGEYNGIIDDDDFEIHH